MSGLSGAPAVGPTAGSARARFRPDVEGLRAIAVLLVVAYHAGVPGFSGGYVGVDVFFVLSGYLITGLLVREAEATGTVGLASFYARRARRLLPAMLVVVVAVGAVGAVGLAPFEQARVARTAFMTAAYLSNVHFARGRTDYLGAAAETDPLLHTWSLAVEEQFYLVWPLVVLFGLGVLFRRGGAPSQRRLVGVMAAVAAASLALCVAWTQTRQPWAFFLSPPRAWEFAAGALGALVAVRTRFDGVLGWLGLGGILASAALFGAEMPFPGWTAGLPVLSTVAALRAGTADPDGRTVGGRLAGVLGGAPFQVLGRLSYSWYLWHWPALVLGAAVVPGVGLGGRVALATGSLGLAAASYRFVEEPVRRSAGMARRPWASLGATLAATVLALVATRAWTGAAEQASLSPEQHAFVAARDDLAPVYASGCHATFETVRADVAGCTSGAPEARRTVVLLGDSHAAQWQPALEASARARSWRLVSLTKSSCPALDAPVFSRFLGRTYTECAAWRRDALGAIQSMRPDLVVVTSEAERALPDSAWEGGTRRVLEALRASGARVVLLRDTPRAPFDVPTCLTRRAWRGQDGGASACAFGVSARPAVWEAQRRAAEEAGAEAADVTEAVCPGGSCPTERDGILVWRDEHHLTASMARALAPDLAAAVGM